MQSLEQRRRALGDVGRESGAEVRHEPTQFRDTPVEVKACSTAGMDGWAAAGPVEFTLAVAAMFRVRVLPGFPPGDPAVATRESA